MRLVGVVCALLALAMFVHADDRRVLLRDVRKMTFVSGAMTASFRHPARPQIVSANATSANVTEVNCWREGNDVGCLMEMHGAPVGGGTCMISTSGHPVCTGKLFNITCEGYERDDDPYILARSCSIEHNLSHDAQKDTRTRANDSVAMALVCGFVLILMIYVLCTQVATLLKSHAAPLHPVVQPAPPAPPEPAVVQHARRVKSRVWDDILDREVRRRMRAARQ